MTTETCGPSHLGWFPSFPLSSRRSSFACTLGVLLFHLGWSLLTFLLLLPVWYWEKMRTGWGGLRQKLNSSKAVHQCGTNLVKWYRFHKNVSRWHFWLNWICRVALSKAPNTIICSYWAELALNSQSLQQEQLPRLIVKLVSSHPSLLVLHRNVCPQRRDSNLRGIVIWQQPDKAVVSSTNVDSYFCFFSFSF